MLIIPLVAADGTQSAVTLPDPVVTTSGFNDGFANAPAGPAQLPTLLQGYPHRPAWHVPGVDYAVGPRVTTFKIPGVDPVPPGSNFTAYPDQKVFYLDQDNAHIAGWDLTVDGGWQILGGYQAGPIGSNAVIEDNRMKVGANNAQPIQILGIDNYGSTAQNITIRYNEIDGSGATHDIGGRALIEASLSGLHTVEYNYFHDAATDIYDPGADLRGSGRPTAVVVRYNAMVNGAQNPNGHSDWWQTAEVTNGPGPGKLYGTFTIEFNLIAQLSFPTDGGTQGLTLDANLKAAFTEFGGGSIANNVFIAKGGPLGVQSYITRIALNCTNGVFNIKNNYVDPSMLNEPVARNTFLVSVGSGTFAGKQVCSGNIDMRNNNPLDNSQG